MSCGSESRSQAYGKTTGPFDAEPGRERLRPLGVSEIVETVREMGDVCRRDRRPGRGRGSFGRDRVVNFEGRKGEMGIVASAVEWIEGFKSYQQEPFVKYQRVGSCEVGLSLQPAAPSYF